MGTRIILPGVEEPDLLSPTGISRRLHLTGFAEQANEPMRTSEAPQSLLLNPDRMRALPEEMRDYNCSSCDRRAAGWAFLPTNHGADPDPIPICSLCWLYLSHWGRTCVKEIPNFISRYEAVNNRALTKDGEDRLTDHRQGDDVVMQLLKASVLFLRMQAARNRIDGR